jgi:hypothetical protein
MSTRLFICRRSFGSPVLRFRSAMIRPDRSFEMGSPNRTVRKSHLLHCLPGGPASAEAMRLATTDGFPDPSAVADKPEVEGEVATFLKDRGGRPLWPE